MSLLNSDDRTIPPTCRFSFLNPSAPGKSALSTILAPARRSVSIAASKDAMTGDVGSAHKVFRGTPTVIPLRSVPLQQVVKSGTPLNGMSCLPFCYPSSSVSENPANGQGQEKPTAKDNP